MLAQIRERGATVYDAEAAITLRAIEQGARDSHKAGGSGTAYLELMGRLLQVNRATQAAQQAGSPKPSSIIIP